MSLNVLYWYKETKGVVEAPSGKFSKERSDKYQWKCIVVCLFVFLKEKIITFKSK